MKSLSIQFGQRFGAWTVTGNLVRSKFGEGRGANYPVLYPCRCDCGTERLVRAFKLLGNSKSCGCQRVAAIREHATVHGMNRQGARHPLYTAWDGIQQRCGNPKHANFAQYGGRGIAVEWAEFPLFAAWALANGWRRGLQIDRINNDGNYSPANCRFVTDYQNKRNKSTNVNVSAFGDTKCLTDWALDARCSVSPGTIAVRMRGGMSTEQAIAAPRRSKKRSPRFADLHAAMVKTSRA